MTQSIICGHHGDRWGDLPGSMHLSGPRRMQRRRRRRTGPVGEQRPNGLDRDSDGPRVDGILQTPVFVLPREKNLIAVMDDDDQRQTHRGDFRLLIHSVPPGMTVSTGRRPAVSLGRCRSSSATSMAAAVISSASRSCGIQRRAGQGHSKGRSPTPVCRAKAGNA